MESIPVGMIIAGGFCALGSMGSWWHQNSYQFDTSVGVGWFGRPIVLLSLLVMMLGTASAVSRRALPNGITLSVSILLVLCTVIAAFSSHSSASRLFKNAGFYVKPTASIGLVITAVASGVILALAILSSFNRNEVAEPRRGGWI